PQLVPRRKESADKDPPTGSHKHTRLRRRAMMLRGGKYKGGESAPRPSAFARFKKPKLPGAHTGKTFGKLPHDGEVLRPNGEAVI
ncbi:hypothetical protein PF007_g29748, partial [Phytophthora fragariae]